MEHSRSRHIEVKKNRYILKQLPSLDDKALEEVSNKVWTLQMERSLSEKREHK